MKRVIVVLLLLLLAGCSREPGPGTENPVQDIPRVSYERDGKNYSGIEYQDALNAMEWLGLNTPKDAIVLAWWDTGHTIRGITGRDAVVYEPSREILFTVSKYAVMSEEERAAVECPECGSHEHIVDVANALLTLNPAETAEVMRKYDAEYAFVSEQDSDKAYAILLVLEMDPWEYLTSNYKPKESAAGLMLFRMIEAEEIPGFELAYSDEGTRIYRLVS